MMDVLPTLSSAHMMIISETLRTTDSRVAVNQKMMRILAPDDGCGGVRDSGGCVGHQLISELVNLNLPSQCVCTGNV